MNIVFHYPPELMLLLIDTIPLLCRSKRDVLLFFQGAGVPEADLDELLAKLQNDKTSISKYEIVRTVLARMNERGEPALRERREVLKQMIEWEDFSTCWPDDQLKAKGLVGEIRRVIDVKDSFTRMNQERENERRQRMAQKDTEATALQEKRTALEAIKVTVHGFLIDLPPICSFA